jgi:hypothetical protein
MNEKINFSIDAGFSDIGVAVAGGPGVYYRIQNVGHRAFTVVRKPNVGNLDFHTLHPNMGFDIYKSSGDSLLVQSSVEGTVCGWFQILAFV